MLSVFVDVLVTADDVDNGRPAPDMITLAMDKLDITDSQYVLKAGDSSIDIEEGKRQLWFGRRCFIWRTKSEAA